MACETTTPARILVIDAQGGGLGSHIIRRIREELPDAVVTAVGTNAAATQAMLKAGADRGATGENAVAVNVKACDYIIGPMGILVADSMLGEVTANMAVSIGRAEAKKILVPFSRCNTIIAGITETGTNNLADAAVKALKNDIFKQ